MLGPLPIKMIYKFYNSIVNVLQLYLNASELYFIIAVEAAVILQH